MEQKAYFEHPGRAVEDKRFSHMMALSLDPNSGYKEGIIRCITSREGDIEVKGTIDRSELHKVSGETAEHFIVGEQLRIRNTQEIIDKLGSENLDFLGLEDPDIFIDKTTGLTHVYFTMPFISRDNIEGRSRIHLGHAIGENMDSLEMTMPVLQANAKNTAKEVSIAPMNSRGFRFNLFESSSVENKVWYSTVRVAIAEDMGKLWKYGDTVFHPAEHNLPWIAGHASPGPLFPNTFIDVGSGKRVGVMNGCEANKMIRDQTKYGTFSVGLFIYDYEKGKVDWVSPKPFIQDSQAGKTRAITFASQFVETNPGEGILYAHIDDSFVRAYTLYAEGIRALLP